MALTLKFHVTREEKLEEHKLPIMLDHPWHLTASAVVVAAGHILMVHHKRIGAWLPPGGHPHGGELPHQTAVRETLEETGVAVKVVSEPLPESSDSQAFFLPQPLCTHLVYANEKGSSLYHLDVAYLCQPVQPVLAGQQLPAPSKVEEVHCARWFDLSAIGTDIVLAKNVEGIIALALAKLGAGKA